MSKSRETLISSDFEIVQEVESVHCLVIVAVIAIFVMIHFEQTQKLVLIFLLQTQTLKLVNLLFELLAQLLFVLFLFTCVHQLHEQVFGHDCVQVALYLLEFF